VKMGIKINVSPPTPTQEEVDDIDTRDKVGQDGWGPKDFRCRDRLLDDVFSQQPDCIPTMLPPRRSPEIASLICLPQDLMTRKLHILLSNLSLVGSLMLAGIIKVGLEPDDSKSFDDDDYKHILTNISNFLNALIITTNVCIVLFATYAEIQLTMDCDQNILRVVSEAGGLVYFQYFAFLSGLLVLVKSVIANYIYSTGVFKFMGVIVVTFLFFGAWVHFFFTVGLMFPYTNGRWARVFLPFLWKFRPDMETSMDKVIVSMKKGARSNFGDEIQPFLEQKLLKKTKSTKEEKKDLKDSVKKRCVSLSSSSSIQIKETHDRLFEWLRRVLVKTTSIDRCHDIAEVFIQEGVDEEMLFGSQKQESDKEMLLVALKGGLGKKKLKLSLGERITLANL